MTKALVEDEAFTSGYANVRLPHAGAIPSLLAQRCFSSKASDFVNGHLLFVDGGMLVAV